MISNIQHTEGSNGSSELNVFNCYTVAQVALLLKVKKSFVYELINTKRLKAIRFSERRFRIPVQALIDFVGQETASQVQNNDTAVQPPKRGRRPNVH